MFYDDVQSTPQEQVIHEGKAEVFLPTSVFYNPVQEFNRDLTVAVIRQFVEDSRSCRANDRDELSPTTADRDHPSSPMDRSRSPNPIPDSSESAKDIRSQPESAETSPSRMDNRRGSIDQPAATCQEGGIRILEGLAASGLRSVRFALEIPGVRQIVANDFDESAVDFIRRNAAHNGVETLVEASLADVGILLYQHRRYVDRFDVVDLDPYGSPAQYLDAAVQAVQDGGLLCVTCTDLAILCGNAAETCHAKYGAMSLRAGFCHEMALRIVLRSIEGHANIYSRYLVPVLSISADFYVRVFVKIYTGQSRVKESVTKLSTVFYCVGCGAFSLQPVGSKVAANKGASDGAKYSAAAGPPVGLECVHCGSRHHLAGPIWSEPIHDMKFVGRVLESVQASAGDFKTAGRMQGMLTLIMEELQHSPLYYIMDDVCRVVHCTTPSLLQFRSAILHSGYDVSLSHAEKNSLKTNAPAEVIWDIVRCWVKDHPVKGDRIKDGSVAMKILAKEPALRADFTEIDFKKYPCKRLTEGKCDLVDCRYSHENNHPSDNGTAKTSTADDARPSSTQEDDVNQVTSQDGNS